MICQIKIQSHAEGMEEVKKTTCRATGIFEGVDVEKMSNGEKITVGFLEKGTQGGQTSLMIGITDPTGVVHLAEITANQFEMLIAAFAGTVQRFGK